MFKVHRRQTEVRQTPLISSRFLYMGKMMSDVDRKNCSCAFIWRYMQAIIIVVLFSVCCLQFHSAYVVFLEKRILQSYTKIEINSTVAVEVQKPNKTLLTLFTTLDSSMENMYVYNNTLHMWNSFGPHVELLLFSDDTNVTSYAESLGWKISPILNTACNDTPTPVLKTMFEYATNTSDSYFYGYANADILFGLNFIRTLLEISTTKLFKERQILITGRRIDIGLENKLIRHKHIRTHEQLDEISRYGLFSYGYAEDYFITNRQYSWSRFPNLVVGRPRVDNWLIFSSRKRGVYVIDASATVIAVHQKTEKRKPKFKSNCNDKMLIHYKNYFKRGIRRGNVECAQYETKYNNEGKIFLLRRGVYTTIC